MKIAITGANCFIGKRLVEYASKKDCHIVAVVRKGNLQRAELESMKNVSVVELNMEDYEKLGSMLGTVECFVHLAWNGTRGESRLNELQQKENYEYGMKAIISMVEAGCKRVVTAGSQAEYGINNSVITEETPCCPNTAYGIYKVKLYEDAYEYCKGRDVSFKEPRYFSLYGPDDYENTLIISSIKKMMQNEPCNFTECMQEWDYLYIDDAIRALYELCIKDCADGAYNFGSGDCRILREFISEIKEILRSDSILNYGIVPYGAAGIVSIHPCIDKLKNELSWEPQVSFSEGIRKIAENMK